MSGVEEKLTFQTHPLKDEIVQKWKSEWDNKRIHLWLKDEHPKLTLSVATLCKHYKRFTFNTRQSEAISTETKAKKRRRNRKLPIEDILWETVNQCRKMKQSDTISTKDWQYLDQQMQAAVEKLIRIQDSSGDSRDIAVVLTEIFSKIGAGDVVDLEDISKRNISESEKNEIAIGVDSEIKNGEGTST